MAEALGVSIKIQADAKASIEAFSQLKRTLAQNEASLNAAREEAARLAAQLKATGGTNVGLKSQFDAARARATALRFIPACAGNRRPLPSSTPSRRLSAGPAVFLVISTRAVIGSTLRSTHRTSSPCQGLQSYVRGGQHVEACWFIHCRPGDTGARRRATTAPPHRRPGKS